LLKKSVKLCVFGDSYSTPDICVRPQDSFWGLAAQSLGIEQIQNYSHPGFSLDHVMHILLNETFDFDSDYFLIGVPPLIRYVSYSDSYRTTWHLREFDKNFSQSTQTIDCLSNTQRFNFKEQFGHDLEKIDRFNSEWNDVQCLEKIFLLHQFLKGKNAKFIIANLSTPIVYQDFWPAGCKIMIRVKQLTECIVFDDTYYSVNYHDQIKPSDYDQYAWYGHHGPEGNANWFNKVIRPKMTKLNWINHA